jgi:hypothetical protein
LTKKKPSKKATKKKTAPRAVKSKKEPMAAKAPAKAEKTRKLEITPKLRRIWFRIRKSYNISLSAFSNVLSSLDDEESEMLYELVRHAIYKGSVAEIIRAKPVMRELVKTDEDRLCMHDCYEHLSWKLRKKEPEPKDRAILSRFRLAVKRTYIP